MLHGFMVGFSHVVVLFLVAIVQLYHSNSNHNNNNNNNSFIVDLIVESYLSNYSIYLAPPTHPVQDDP